MKQLLPIVKRADRWSQLTLIAATSDWQVLIDQQSYC